MVQMCRPTHPSCPLGRATEISEGKMFHTSYLLFYLFTSHGIHEGTSHLRPFFFREPLTVTWRFYGTLDIDMRDNGSVSGELTEAAAAIWESGSVAWVAAAACAAIIESGSVPSRAALRGSSTLCTTGSAADWLLPLPNFFTLPSVIWKITHTADYVSGAHDGTICYHLM